MIFIAGVQPKTVTVDDTPRICPSCGLSAYPRLSPAVIVAVVAVIWERRDQLGRTSMETPPRTLGRLPR